METGYERYSKHAVWETLQLKLDSLRAARYDDPASEQGRNDIVEWLQEAQKTRAARQPALYLTALNNLSVALNQVPVDTTQFKSFIAHRQQSGQPYQALEHALRALPLPPPKDLKSGYVDLLDKEVIARTERLNQLEARIQETEKALEERRAELGVVSMKAKALEEEIQVQRDAIKVVSETAASDMKSAWNESFEAWKQERKKVDAAHDSEALESIAILAAVTKAGEALAEHAAGVLSAADWYERAKRERWVAHWIRVAAMVAFVFAGVVGYFIVSEAVVNNFELSLGGGILRASVAVVIGAFGALLLRESRRHFREADTAEDVALSLRALAPFYASSDEEVRLEARVKVGDAILVRNVLSRFSNRDAAKHATDIDTAQLSELVTDSTKALRKTDGIPSP